jgi:hypothetical protein
MDRHRVFATTPRVNKQGAGHENLSPLRGSKIYHWVQAFDLVFMAYCYERGSVSLTMPGQGPGSPSVAGEIMPWDIGHRPAEMGQAGVALVVPIFKDITYRRLVFP